MSFALYPVEQHWWSFQDYQMVMDTTRRLGAKTVLEFGPGSSTLALIEGGATRIDCCEDHPDWAATYADRLQARFPKVVRMCRYVWSDPLSISATDRQRYDLGLIDGPQGTARRPAAIAYAIARCASVLVPTESYQVEAPILPGCITALAAEAGRSVEFYETGPLSGSFALVGAPC